MVVNLNIIRDEASTKSDKVGFELIEIVFRVNRSVFIYYWFVLSYISLATSLDWCIFVFVSFSLESPENLMIDNLNHIHTFSSGFYFWICFEVGHELPTARCVLPTLHYPTPSLPHLLFLFAGLLFRPSSLLIVLFSSVCSITSPPSFLCLDDGGSARASVSVMSRLCAMDGSEPAGVMWRDAAPRRIAHCTTRYVRYHSNTSWRQVGHCKLLTAAAGLIPCLPSPCPPTHLFRRQLIIRETSLDWLIHLPIYLTSRLDISLEVTVPTSTTFGLSSTSTMFNNNP